MGYRIWFNLLAVTLWAVLAATSARAEPVRLNFQDADISALINTVAEVTGKNFVIDPRVKGKVTVVSPKPMERDELYQVFLSILQVHGYAAIPVGHVVKIVPDAKARQEGTSTENEQSLSGDEIVTRVIPIQNVQAVQLVPVLRPLIPQEGHLAASPTANALVISDRASNVRRLASLISAIDRSSDSSIEVIRLNHASAAEVARILAGLEKAQPGQPPGQNRLTIAADERTNSILIGGEPSERLRLRALVAHLDTPLETGGNTQVVYLRYAKAADLVPVLSGISGTLVDEKTKKPISTDKTISIQADDAANALVITAPPDVYRSLESVIRRLDVRRAQVLVQAIVAEISLDKARELGVQWAVDGTQGSNSGVVSGTNFSAGSSSIVDIARSIRAGDIPNIGDGLGLAVGRLGSNAINYALLLRALSNDATTNILSTPTLMTLDNQQAEIVVGQNVPFVTGQFTNTGAAAGSVNPFQTIQRQDIGLTLRVTPQINEGNAVQLEVEQEVSSIAPSSAAADIITNKRSIKTTVMVEDGAMVVLGGLIDDTLQTTNQKVPGLGDIPVLGRLFRYDKTQKVKRDLVVFLRPTIVRDAAVQAEVTGDKYNYIRARQLEMQEQGVDLMPDAQQPVLPREQFGAKGNADAGPDPQSAATSGSDSEYYEGDCVCDEETPDEFARSIAGKH